MRREYNKKFKLTSVHLMKSRLFKPTEIFEMLSEIDRQTVYRWVSEYNKDSEAARQTLEMAIREYGMTEKPVCEKVIL